VFALSRNERIIGFVEVIQQALVQWQAGPQNGGQYRLFFKHFALRNTQWGLYFFFFIYQVAADLISGYFTNTFQVPAETHAIRLNLNIPDLTDPLTNQGAFFAKVNNH
jgi:hypothetical protein